MLMLLVLVNCECSNHCMYVCYGSYMYMYKYTCLQAHTLTLSHPHTYTDISPPVSTRLTISDVYDENGKPSPAVLKKHFTNEGRVDEDVALRIISEGTCYTEIYKIILKFTKI